MKSKSFIGVAAVLILVFGAALSGYLVALSGHSAHQSMAAASAEPAGEKQMWHCGMHPWVMQDHPGDCPVCHMKLTPMHASDSGSSPQAQAKPLYYWDPMLGPSSISDKPGKSAMGMDLVPVFAASAGPRVTIDPTVIQNMGVRTEQVTRGPLPKTVRTIGVLKSPEPGLFDVSVKVGGWIDALNANQEGMHITKGDVLFKLYSPDLQVAEEELISAVKAEHSLDANAPADLRKEALGLIESVKRKLRLWDVADQDIDMLAEAQAPPKDVPFRSPASGHMVEKMVVQGTAVQPGMKLMRIEDHSQIWLDAQVYEDQLPAVKMGQDVTAEVDGVPGQRFKGKINFFYPHVDHMTRTLTVRITLDNPDFALKPGMYATAEIVTQPIEDAIQAPREAVIDTGTRQIVFVAEGEGHFSPRNVRMGMVGDNDRAQIVDGLAPGETVVTSGQFLMDVESRTIEAIDKLRNGGNAPAAPANIPNTAAMAPMTEPPPSPPAATASAVALSVIYCPMKKANWLQQGQSIANPYLGMAMPTCGEVKNTFAPLAADSKLQPVIAAYLVVATALDTDKLDAVALARLKSAAVDLADAKYAELKAAALALADTRNIPDARVQFKSVSDQLISLLSADAK